MGKRKLSADTGITDTTATKSIQDLHTREKLVKEVQCFVSGTSEKLFPAPRISDILADVLERPW